MSFDKPSLTMWSSCGRNVDCRPYLALTKLCGAQHMTGPRHAYPPHPAIFVCKMHCTDRTDPTRQQTSIFFLILGAVLLSHSVVSILISIIVRLCVYKLYCITNFLARAHMAVAWNCLLTNGCHVFYCRKLQKRKITPKNAAESFSREEEKGLAVFYF